MDNKTPFNFNSNDAASSKSAAAPVFAAGSAIPSINNTSENIPGDSNNGNVADTNVANNATAPISVPQKSLPLLIGLIIASLVAVTFLGLFIWIWGQWSDLSKDFNSKRDEAVALAVDEQAKKDQAKFEAEQKSDVTTFSGPVDYGEFSFSYPKTWSVYVAKDASDGGSYEAYLNPGKVVNSSDAIYAIRVFIYTESYDSIISKYSSALEDGSLTLSTRQVNGTTVNVYTGAIDEKHNGILTVIKIRDKTVIFQTDSVDVFSDDYDRILSTIKFNA
jgi:hypothetical protein